MITKFYIDNNKRVRFAFDFHAMIIKSSDVTIYIDCHSKEMFHLAYICVLFRGNDFPTYSCYTTDSILNE